MAKPLLSDAIRRTCLVVNKKQMFPPPIAVFSSFSTINKCTPSYGRISLHHQDIISQKL